jgi:hypothetical protein
MRFLKKTSKYVTNGLFPAVAPRSTNPKRREDAREYCSDIVPGGFGGGQFSRSVSLLLGFDRQAVLWAGGFFVTIIDKARYCCWKENLTQVSGFPENGHLFELTGRQMQGAMN